MSKLLYYNDLTISNRVVSNFCTLSFFIYYTILLFIIYLYILTTLLYYYVSISYKCSKLLFCYN